MRRRETVVVVHVALFPVFLYFFGTFLKFAVALNVLKIFEVSFVLLNFLMCSRMICAVLMCE